MCSLESEFKNELGTKPLTDMPKHLDGSAWMRLEDLRSARKRFIMYVALHGERGLSRAIVGDRRQRQSLRVLPSLGGGQHAHAPAGRHVRGSLMDLNLGLSCVRYVDSARSAGICCLPFPPSMFGFGRGYLPVESHGSCAKGIHSLAPEGPRASVRSPQQG